jgi:hypothetical protein
MVRPGSNMGIVEMSTSPEVTIIARFIALMIDLSSTVGSRSSFT